MRRAPKVTVAASFFKLTNVLPSAEFSEFLYKIDRISYKLKGEIRYRSETHYSNLNLKLFYTYISFPLH